jgi:hypothetical protein
VWAGNGRVEYVKESDGSLQHSHIVHVTISETETKRELATAASFDKLLAFGRYKHSDGNGGEEAAYNQGRDRSLPKKKGENSWRSEQQFCQTSP